MHTYIHMSVWVHATIKKITIQESFLNLLLYKHLVPLYLTKTGPNDNLTTAGGSHNALSQPHQTTCVQHKSSLIGRHAYNVTYGTLFDQYTGLVW